MLSIVRHAIMDRVDCLHQICRICSCKSGHIQPQKNLKLYCYIVLMRCTLPKKISSLLSIPHQRTLLANAAVKLAIHLSQWTILRLVQQNGRTYHNRKIGMMHVRQNFLPSLRCHDCAYSRMHQIWRIHGLQEEPLDHIAEYPSAISKCAFE